ncbi:antibiotic biosynthesis monooxygenase [Planctomycetaceae bacterium]|nr:antibiotic biosynthesis monooxygenase [Planctomycetaceae bacterium]
MICMNIVLTVQEDHKIEVVRDLLCEAMRKSRNEPGCERFDVYQSQSKPNQFMMIEHWSSQEALDAHRQAEAYTTIYKPQVIPLVERVGHPVTLLD